MTRGLEDDDSLDCHPVPDRPRTDRRAGRRDDLPGRHPAALPRRRSRYPRRRNPAEEPAAENSPPRSLRGGAGSGGGMNLRQRRPQPRPTRSRRLVQKPPSPSRPRKRPRPPQQSPAPAAEETAPEEPSAEPQTAEETPQPRNLKHPSRPSKRRRQRNPRPRPMQVTPPLANLTRTPEPADEDTLAKALAGEAGEAAAEAAAETPAEAPEEAPAEAAAEAPAAEPVLDLPVQPDAATGEALVAAAAEVPEDEPVAGAEVTEEVVTEETARSSDEDFANKVNQTAVEAALAATAEAEGAGSRAFEGRESGSSGPGRDRHRGDHLEQSQGGIELGRPHGRDAPRWQLPDHQGRQRAFASARPRVVDRDLRRSPPARPSPARTDRAS